MKQFSKGKMVSYAALMIVLMLGATFLANGIRNREQTWDFGQWTDEAVASALAAYEQAPDNERLSRLLKGLCWQYRVQNQESVKPLVLAYGQELLERAKAGTADLEALDGDGVLSQVLTVIREAGAK